MSVTLEAANDALRQAVETRLAHPRDLPTTNAESCREGQRCERKFYGHSLLEPEVHPTSQKYFDLLQTLRELHVSKSAGYGCPDGTDPLLNIRRGAEFVGIPAWQGAMVRLSDKVTRLAVFNKTGNLPHESVRDTLLDLASYSLLALLLWEEE